MSTVYYDRIEWDGFLEPVVMTGLKSLKGVYFLKAEWTIEFHRDQDYKLKGVMKGTLLNGEEVESRHRYEPGDFIELDEVVCQDRMTEYRLFGFSIGNQKGQTMLSNGAYHFEMEVSVHWIERISDLSEDFLQDGSVLNEWFISNKVSFLFPRFTDRRATTRYVKARKGIDEEQEFMPSRLSNGSRDYLLIECRGVKCIVAEIPKGLGPAWAQCIGIEYRAIWGIPDEDTRKAISEFVGFIFGVHLLAVGSTELKNFVPWRETGSSPWGDNVRAKCGGPAFPPIELDDNSRPGYVGSHVEVFINQLLPVYLEKKEVLGLTEALWKYWVARRLPIGVNLPILSSGVETMIFRYLKTAPGFSSTYMEAKSFRKLIDGPLSAMAEALVQVPEGDKMVRKMEGAYNRSANEKIQMFFELSGLPIGKVEDEAMKARHAMAHVGGVILSDTEAKESIRKTRAYETLFHRILLRLLGYEGKYIDYYMKGHPLRMIEERIGG